MGYRAATGLAATAVDVLEPTGRLFVVREELEDVFERLDRLRKVAEAVDPQLGDLPQDTDLLNRLEKLGS